MNDREFLSWMAERLVHVYNESPNVDFVQRLKKMSEDKNLARSIIDKHVPIRD